MRRLGRSHPRFHRDDIRLWVAVRIHGIYGAGIAAKAIASFVGNGQIGRETVAALRAFHPETQPRSLFVFNKFCMKNTGGSARHIDVHRVLAIP
ncbi:hypothetical protein SAMN05216548_102148 [Faunimonas pinastri]|uniref:Uncharacterized protein n=1 Tax=Faunimonas pinastri TaxID=1855383 RepID=A0A1H9CGJ7_9HYPH|nr:hypothetical protein [Faunimonas pinastri]SEQ00360.1 hypothetical protein SAMN05216548_102148 [Faunimonas pinastri]